MVRQASAKDASSEQNCLPRKRWGSLDADSAKEPSTRGRGLVRGFRGACRQ